MAGSDRGMVVVGLDNLSIDWGSFLDSRVHIGVQKKTQTNRKKGLGNMLRVALII